jgi:hypothetical protein
LKGGASGRFEFQASSSSQNGIEYAGFQCIAREFANDLIAETFKLGEKFRFKWC